MFEIVRWSALAMGLAVCGCQTSPVGGAIHGVPADIEKLQLDPIASANRESQFIEGLRIRAGLAQTPTLPVPPEDWNLILRAGIRVIDGQCDQYLDALFRFNREQRAVRQGLAATAGATASILGLAGVAAIPIAITAAAFGLSASLFDAGVNSVLFTIEPSALRNVVLEGRSKFVKVVLANPPTNRPDTMIALQGYLTQCSPAAIEANINNAANGSRNAVTSPNDDQATRAAILAAPAVTLSRRERAAQENTTRVNPAPAPPPPVVAVADVRLEGEAGVTQTQVAAVQRALGITATGLLGPQDSPTRLAIMEFERGMKARNEPGWGEPTGRLAGRTADTLIPLGPMPAFLQSPFERAFLTNTSRTAGGAARHTAIDEQILAEVWATLGIAAAREPATMWKTLRDAIVARRETVSLEKGRTSLDSALWARIRL